MPEPTTPGAVVWQDLTVADAAALAGFYSQIAGWSVQPHAMDGYDDYCMQDASGKTVAGICHARGSNANVPPQWLVYISVPDVAAAAERCTALGGSVLDGPRDMGGRPFCVVRDPAGAVAALIQG